MIDKYMKYDFVQTYLKDIVIHRVGNKFISEECVFAKHSSTLDEQVKLLLTHFFLRSFNSNDLYQFTNEVNLDLNVVYSCIKSIFENPVSIYEQSLNVAKYLYSKSVHPNIKGGEFFICYFKDCNFENSLIDAIGIFKTEVKDTFLEVEQLSEEVILYEKHGININKLDKGCIVFNINEENGYSLLVVDNINKSNSARYWKDDFLSAKILQDDFYKTKYLLDLTKKFVKSEEFLESFENKKNKDVEILNKSSNYFKENEEFYLETFEEEVLKDESTISLFKNFERKNNIDNLPQEFKISQNAVNKKASSLIKTLKLDNNFKIYIQGGSDFLEKGIDEEGRKFYKFYYDEEM